MFYDNSILSGTKMLSPHTYRMLKFYDNSILSGTKISNSTIPIKYFSIRFTITHNHYNISPLSKKAFSI